MILNKISSWLIYWFMVIWRAIIDQLLLISCLRISKSSGLAILPSPFLSMAETNCLTSCWLTYLFRPKLLNASLMRLNISFSSSVPLLSVSYLLKMASMAWRSWSSDGFPLIINIYLQITRFIRNLFIPKHQTFIIHKSNLIYYFIKRQKKIIVFFIFVLKSKPAARLFLFFCY